MLKPEYLQLIDLLRRHREMELGKTGITRVPATEVAAIGPEHHIEQYLRALIEDEILRPINKDGKEVPYVTEGKGESREMVVYCAKTTEEMLAYRRSLIIQGALGIQVDTHGGRFYEAYRNGYPEDRVPLSDNEGCLLNSLISRPNVPRSREEVGSECGLSPKQVSNALNSIRRKLAQLDFTEEKVEEMLPRYARGSLMFNNQA